ncbi:MAG: hypothetical protein OEW68_17045 [Gammaproteobacteria bacterium]|nr:hypothetical protein [Gammaproteobacteria bacterium]MDH4316523.1 hypothetical protein [Gammaproteobacteria bacterium]MDH5215762.1 hypothetical protein [Gammaproteobacteria bacterium]
MTCQQLNDELDDYIDGLCPDAKLLDRHVATCDDCRQRVDREQRLRAALADYAVASMPQPDPAFFDRALATAVQARNTRHHNRGWLKGFGSAIAAGLVIWFVASNWASSPTMPDVATPQVTMALEDPRTINLVFSSATNLDDATLTVSLPPGIELHGFRGQREISWVTSLREGRNVLPLKLVALSPQGGELLATLRHHDDDKTFRLKVTVTQAAS